MQIKEELYQKVHNSVKIEGDYIFLLDDNFLVPGSEYICFVYKKSDEKVPEDWKKYPSDW